MVRRVLLIVGLLVLSRSLFATTYYVRSGATGTTCTTYQTDNAANASPSIALAVACVNGGSDDDTVTVRAGTFTETTQAVLAGSGTSGHPIIIQGAGAGSTIWTRSNCGVSGTACAFLATNRSYFRVTGFTIQNMNGKSIIEARVTTGVVTGPEVTNCEFINNGNRGQLDGSDINIMVDFGAYQGSGSYASIVFTGNTLTNNYGFMFRTRQCAGGGTISNNISTGTKSSKQSSGHYSFRGLMQAGGSTANLLIENNQIYNMSKDSYVTGSNCGPSGTSPCNWQGTGIKFDTGAGSSIIRGNIIHDVLNPDPGSNRNFEAIMVESGCNDNLITQNTIWNVNIEGIRVGSNTTSPASRNIVSNNSIRTGDAGCGIDIIKGTDTTIKNNIVHLGSSTQSAYIFKSNDTGTGGHTFNSGTTTWKNNLHYDPSGGSINASGSTTAFVGDCQSPNKTIAQWTSATGETFPPSINADPTFVSSTDLTLVAGSPAIDAGDDGNDMGSQQSLTPPEPATLTVTFPNGGETLSVGAVSAVTWSSANLTGSVSVLLSFNNGATYDVTISSSVAGSAGTVAWNVGVPSCTQCLVKVTSLVDGAVFDASDAAFTKVGINLR